MSDFKPEGHYFWNAGVAGRTELTEASDVTAQRHSIAPHTTLTPRAARLSGVRAQNEAPRGVRERPPVGRERPPANLNSHWASKKPVFSGRSRRNAARVTSFAPSTGNHSIAYTRLIARRVPAWKARL